MAETLPLFPLSAVLLPGASLPLHIFEPRYRQLTVDLVTETLPDRCFGVTAIRQGWETDVLDRGQLHEIGCSAVLEQVKRLPDGRFDLLARGDRRFRLLELDSTSAPYLFATIEWVPDTEPPTEAALSAPLLADAARAAHARYRSAAMQRAEWVKPAADADPATLAHVIAADCLLALEDRQLLLEETCPVRRLRLVRQILGRETEILRSLGAVPAPLADLGQPPSTN
ncbi:LON peptidase substrate-binding domain-containing protein [Gandjariella thermophila]|uniref:Peptidase n=1 Tax=Gandjariella thermophila TaxID=1931992 RepID=A0A4D4JDR4_9PSEU|nr:LON peptidase substrate-binding domain-containing protein [Gandjariella thermophila]GDY32788.1 peptidase [Gandjariella thermophila]